MYCGVERKKKHEPFFVILQNFASILIFFFVCSLNILQFNPRDWIGRANNNLHARSRNNIVSDCDAGQAAVKFQSRKINIFNLQAAITARSTTDVAVAKTREKLF